MYCFDSSQLIMFNNKNPTSDPDGIKGIGITTKANLYQRAFFEVLRKFVTSQIFS